MSGKTLLDQIDDLSEDDADFIPAAKSPRASKRRRSQSSNSDTSPFESEDQEAHSSKRTKTKPEDDTERQRKEEQAKRDLQAILNVEEEAKREREAGMQVRNGDELLEIRRPRFFAGETIYETVRLPRTHPDVAKYGTPSNMSQGVQPGTTEQPSTSNRSADSTDIMTPLIPSTTQTDPPTAAVMIATTDTASRRPPPMRRKPRQSLEAMNAALLAAAKGKKMSMTEKSAHDWSAHTTSDTALADQLAANRRENGGGFLEKEAFLGRVEERREGLLDRAKGRRR